MNGFNHPIILRVTLDDAVLLSNGSPIGQFVHARAPLGHRSATSESANEKARLGSAS